ncbi:hypothetical protein OBBRIDRAFT_375717 [Obba rivulosa]|uniref:Uncharacterized protein n=1 Tax=Obba rivulosa TaxID=1052685 RepID=A0A8E2DFC6_9APHY|nr:hypothetical protein OBBRIDRAFT_375717 [Obba rivulosa]
MLITVRVNYRGERAREILSYKSSSGGPAEALFFEQVVQRDLHQFALPPPHRNRLVYGSGVAICQWNTTENSELHRMIRNGFKIAEQLKSSLVDRSISWLSLGDDNHTVDWRISAPQGHSKLKQLYIPKVPKRPLPVASSSTAASAFSPNSPAIPSAHTQNIASGPTPGELQNESGDKLMLDLDHAQDALRELSQSFALQNLLQGTIQEVKSEPVDAQHPSSLLSGPTPPMDRSQLIEHPVAEVQPRQEYPAPISVTVKSERAQSPLLLCIEPHIDVIDLESSTPTRKRSRWGPENQSEDAPQQPSAPKRSRISEDSNMKLSSTPASLLPVKEPPRAPAAVRRAQAWRNAALQSSPAPAPAPVSSSKTHALTRDLWDVRRQITALKVHERNLLLDLRTHGTLPTPGEPDTELLETHKQLEEEVASLRERVRREEGARRAAEAAVREERRRRMHAEGVLDDARREYSQPFVVPALMDVFEQLSKWSTDALIASETALDY